jgi:arylsulfatase A-like enzyme/Flp pilus assembly protein TadD
MERIRQRHGVTRCNPSLGRSPRAKLTPMAAARSLVLLLLALACSRAPRPERVLLVTIDTLRADRVGAYGDARAITPTLDALAASGVRFDAAISPVPITLPAHTTLMTGLQPPHHGVRGNGVFALPAEIPTLAEHMQRAGFANAAFVGAIVLDRHYGLDRGFSHYDDRMSLRHAAGQGGYAERRAEDVVGAALAWIGQAPPRFFAWVHLYDPHANYDPPAEWKGRVQGDPYRSEIAYTDAQLRRLLDGIAARFADGKTLVVVTSDHGEGLNEHGEPFHSFTVYDGTQRIPLIIAGPGIDRGRVVPSVVRLADVAPTLLALAGADALPETDGVDLSDALRGSDGGGRVAYVETLDSRINQGWSPLYGVRTEQWKYIRAPRPELYDVSADPGEHSDLSGKRPEVAAELDREVERAHAGTRALAWIPPPAAPERAQLESLGYVIAAPEPTVDLAVGGIDPKDAVSHLIDLEIALRLTDAHDHLGALARLEAFPGDGAFISGQRALTALDGGNFVKAESYARACVARSPSYADCWVALGKALAAQGKLAEAEAALRRGSAADPADADPLLALGDLCAARSDAAGAARAYEAAIASREGSIPARWRLAALRFSAGDAAGAGRLLAEVPPEELASAEASALLAAGEIEGGYRAEALARIEAALARDPENPALRSLHDQAAAK